MAIRYVVLTRQRRAPLACLLIILASFNPGSFGAELYDHGQPTAHEQFMLELVNRARANPLLEAGRLQIDLNEGLIPGIISLLPKQPLAFRPTLIQSARSHSQWMLDADTFSHTGSAGSQPDDRMKAAGYVFSGSWAWAENVAYKGQTGGLDLDQLTADLHDQLMESSGHRKNILNGNFDEIGVGLLTGAFTTDRQTYNALMGTQNFAKSGSTPGPLVLGVVFQDNDGNGFYSPGEGMAGVTVQSEPPGNYYAVTSGSGGYAFPSPATSGLVAIRISGNGIQSATKSVLASGENIKVDFNPARQSSAQPASGNVEFISGTERIVNGRFEVDLRGPAGQIASIQASTNFQEWTEAGVVLFTASTAKFADPTPVAVRRFFRAQLLP